MKKNQGIETLRVLISLVVVVGHVFQPGRFYADSPGLSKSIWSVADFFISLGLPLFACISGYLYGLSKKGTDGVMVDKVWRLLLPAIGAVLLEVVFRCLLAKSAGPVKLVPQLLFVTPYTLWFLESLFLVFAVVVGLDRLGKLQSSSQHALTFGVAVGTCLIWPTLFQQLEVRYQGLTGVPVLLPAFVAGIWFARQPDLFNKPASRWVIGGILIASLAVLISPGAIIRAGHSSPVHAVLHAWYSGIVALACPLAIQFAPSIAWIGRLGAWSFGIYVFHNLFLNTFVSWGLEKFAVEPSTLVLGVVAILVTALAIAVQWTFQTVPALRPFAGIKPNKKAPPSVQG